MEFETINFWSKLSRAQKQKQKRTFLAGYARGLACARAALSAMFNVLMGEGCAWRRKKESEKKERKRKEKKKERSECVSNA